MQIYVAVFFIKRIEHRLAQIKLINPVKSCKAGIPMYRDYFIG